MSEPIKNSYFFEAILHNGELIDCCAVFSTKKLYMLGESGKARELSILEEFLKEISANRLPVLVGSGLGFALEELLQFLEQKFGKNFPLAIVDKEELLKLTQLPQKYAHLKNLLWLNSCEPKTVLNELSNWQKANGYLSFLPLINPFYLRLDRKFYNAIRKNLQASAEFSFWDKAHYSKFKTEKPRILLLTSKYFLIGELEAACKRLDIDSFLLQIPAESLEMNEFLESLLTTIVNFKPDFALTINHLGVDREGVLQNMLEQLKIPLASWFVDNPHLILHQYHNLVSPWTALFTWDEDNLESLKALGFKHVHYLALGVDHTRFKPLSDHELAKLKNLHPNWIADVSFVGHSMLSKVQGRMEHSCPPKSLQKNYQEIAAHFAVDEERSIRKFLEDNYPDLMPDLLALNIERQLSYEAMLTWEATLQYRLSCVRATLKFKPLIVGDKGWFELLKVQKDSWKYFSELNYYDDLPIFYPLSSINFNATSKQMKGAVNQRIFDVPACAGFIITDWRAQIENLFEPQKEVICYKSPAEAEDLIAFYLKNPQAAKKISKAARKRVLAEHTYDARLKQLITVMHKTFS